MKPGDKVSEGDYIRYRSITNQPVESEVYLVVKTDQHYFEIVRKSDCDEGYSLPPRKLVRYIDIGYNILLERWSEPVVLAGREMIHGTRDDWMVAR